MAFEKQNLNYAVSYGKAMANAYPNVLRFGALYSTENNSKFRWVNADTIEIPSVKTSGRIDGDRDSINLAQRNFNNSWEQKKLKFHRKWSTLVHPMDIDETNLAASITNITEAFNQEQKFPEMDAYTISKLYGDWTKAAVTTAIDDGGAGKTADTTALTNSNVLTVFDNLMLNMDNARVPANGRILYCTFEVKSALKRAHEISRTWDVKSSGSAINRVVSRLDEVEVVGVPSTLMKTKYNFYTGTVPAGGSAVDGDGYAEASDAQQINMFLVHPSAVITPEKYAFSRLDAPSATSEGKYVYFEESYGDVFILNKRADALQFNITATTQSA